MGRIRSRLQEIRRARSVSAADLALRVGVSRQTIYAIEDGTFIPNTTVSLQLARALEVTVEQIFFMEEEAAGATCRAELLSRNQRVSEGQLMRVCRINGRLIALPSYLEPAYLPRAEAVIESTTRQSVSIKTTAGLPEDGKQLLLAGCDPALSLLSESLRNSGIEVMTVPCSSRRALEWLKQGRVHAAGSHLRDRTTGDYNLPIVRRLLPNTSLRVVTFAIWELGLVVRNGNPKGIRSIADLARRRVTLANREKGSGSRDVLDAGLRKLGLPTEQVKGYNSITPGHLAAAWAIASGTADCCVAPRSAARCFGLNFVALAEQRFDLSFTQASLELPATKALLEVLNQSHLRQKLRSIAGYDTAHTGEVLI